MKDPYIRKGYRDLFVFDAIEKRIRTPFYYRVRTS